MPFTQCSQLRGSKRAVDGGPSLGFGEVEDVKGVIRVGQKVSHETEDATRATSLQYSPLEAPLPSAKRTSAARTSLKPNLGKLVL
jgi:hypothetical protein